MEEEVCIFCTRELCTDFPTRVWRAFVKARQPGAAAVPRLRNEVIAGECGTTRTPVRRVLYESL